MRNSPSSSMRIETVFILFSFGFPVPSICLPHRSSVRNICWMNEWKLIRVIRESRSFQWTRCVIYPERPEKTSVVMLTVLLFRDNWNGKYFTFFSLRSVNSVLNDLNCEIYNWEYWQLLRLKTNSTIFKILTSKQKIDILLLDS